MNSRYKPFAGYRYPAEMISYAVWLYFCFVLSFRDVEELLAARGVDLTYETVRQWCLTFGRRFAHSVCCRQGRPGVTCVPRLGPTS